MKQVAFLILVFLSAISPGAEPTTTQAISNTKYARRTLFIGLPESSQMGGGGGGSGWDVQQIFQEQIHDLAPVLVNVSGDNFSLSTSRNGYVLEVDLQRLPDARPAAKEFADAVIAAVDRRLRSENDSAQKQKMDELARGREGATARVDQATAAAQERRRKVREAAGLADVSAQSITAAVSKLEEEKQRLELEQIGKQARREALELEMKKQATMVEDHAANDPVAAELKKVVDVREKKVELVQRLAEKGLATPVEVQDAVVAVADSRAKLLQRMKDAGIEAGGDTLTALNREMVNLSVDLRELEARLKLINSRLPGLQSAMDDLDALQRAEADLKDASNDLAQARADERSALKSTSKTVGVILKKSTDTPPPER